MVQNTNTEPPPPFGSDKIGRYDVVYPLASGGMATVYAGQLSGMAGFEKIVALKVIHPHLACQKQFAEMFLDEARLAARMHHPNIGEIYEVIEDDGKLFIAGEFIAGKSLRHLIRAVKREGKLISPLLAAWIVSQVCQGLQYVHTLTDHDGKPLNLVHRDISTSNILVSFDGWIKLIDFGVAFSENRRSQTMPGNVKGTVGYIAPELLKGAQLDRRADIFSLGVVLYLLTTGKHPFSGKNDAEKLRKILNYELIPPGQQCSAISLELEKIILTALAENPNDRFQSAVQMETALKRYIAAAGLHLGVTELARLMERFFSADKASHHEKISAFRQKSPHIPDAFPTTHILTPMDSLTTVFSEPPQKRSRAQTLFPMLWRVTFIAVLLVITVLIVPSVISISDKASPTVPSVRPPHPRVPRTVPPPVLLSRHMTSRSSDSGGVPRLSANNENARFYNDTVDDVAIVPFSITPPTAEILLPKGEVDRAASVLRLPEKGKTYTLWASAPGYRTEVYRVHPEADTSLSMSLSPLAAKETVDFDDQSYSDLEDSLTSELDKSKHHKSKTKKHATRRRKKAHSASKKKMDSAGGKSGRMRGNADAKRQPSMSPQNKPNHTYRSQEKTDQRHKAVRGPRKRW